MERVAAIMAGGRGERLWPRSRTKLPKQFLSLDHGPSFLQQTYARLAGMSPAPTIVVLTATDTVSLVREQLPDLERDRVLGEPLSRDTAATAALAVAMTRAIRGDTATLALVPADHAVGDADGFRQALSAAYDAAERLRCPVLLGVPPTRPETGYGYIRRGAPLPSAADGAPAIHLVDRFVEKPPVEQAAAYLASGDYLWNCGVCVCSTDVLRDALVDARFSLGDIVCSFGSTNPAWLSPHELAMYLRDLEPISLDYALLEGLEKAAVVEAPAAWDDVGSWESLTRLEAPDPAGNVRKGQAVLSDTADSVVYGAATGRLVVTHGVRDLVVVDTPDSLLVARRGALGGLKRALGRVREEGYGGFVDGSTAIEAAVQPPPPVEVPRPTGGHGVPGAGTVPQEPALPPGVDATEWGHRVVIEGQPTEVWSLRPNVAVSGEEFGERPVRLVSGEARLINLGDVDGMPLPATEPVSFPRSSWISTQPGCALAVGPVPPVPAPDPLAAPVRQPGLRGAVCRTVDKPWGREVWWAVTDRYAAKRLEVRAGHLLSLQYHERKHETLYFLSGRCRLWLEEQTRLVGPGDVAVVEPGTVHRIEAITDAVVFEASTPELEDVVRIEDKYGRVEYGAKG